MADFYQINRLLKKSNPVLQPHLLFFPDLEKSDAWATLYYHSWEITEFLVQLEQGVDSVITKFLSTIAPDFAFVYAKFWLFPRRIEKLAWMLQDFLGCDICIAPLKPVTAGFPQDMQWRLNSEQFQLGKNTLIGTHGSRMPTCLTLIVQQCEENLKTECRNLIDKFISAYLGAEWTHKISFIDHKARILILGDEILGQI